MWDVYLSPFKLTLRQTQGSIQRWAHSPCTLTTLQLAQQTLLPQILLSLPQPFARSAAFPHLHHIGIIIACGIVRDATMLEPSLIVLA